jgi:hypothetical protein
MNRQGTSLIAWGTLGTLYTGGVTWLSFDFVIPKVLELMAGQDGPARSENLASLGLNALLGLTFLFLMAVSLILLVFGLKARSGGISLHEASERDIKSAAFLARSIAAVVAGVMAFGGAMSHVGIHDSYVLFILFSPLVSAVALPTFLTLSLFWLLLNGWVRLVGRATA